VDLRVGVDLGLGESDLLLVGAEEGASVDSLQEKLSQKLPGSDLTRLTETYVPTFRGSVPAGGNEPVGVATGGLVGSMRFKILKDGFIEPDRAWVERNIVRADVPILGSVTCHRLLIPQLAAALGELERRGFSQYVDPSDYGGCYVPRFIDRDPENPLSMHAFGLAVDLNISSNPLGTKGNMAPEVVETFEKWGFVWGGRWSRPDPMHFEIARLIDVEG
jgi:hypothetical protein